MSQKDNYTHLAKIMRRISLSEVEQEGFKADESQLDYESPAPRRNARQKALEWLMGYPKRKNPDHE